jgi:hypothetical protein
MVPALCPQSQHRSRLASTWVRLAEQQAGAVLATTRWEAIREFPVERNRRLRDVTANGGFPSCLRTGRSTGEDHDLLAELTGASTAFAASTPWRFAVPSPPSRNPILAVQSDSNGGNSRGIILAKKDVPPKKHPTLALRFRVPTPSEYAEFGPVADLCSFPSTSPTHSTSSRVGRQNCPSPEDICPGLAQVHRPSFTSIPDVYASVPPKMLGARQNLSERFDRWIEQLPDMCSKRGIRTMPPKTHLELGLYYRRAPSAWWATFAVVWIIVRGAPPSNF